jgi:hypothetical protein
MKRNSLCRLFWALGLLAASLSALGVDRCVLPVAVGRGDGADWANAMGGSFSPVRGNTYFIGGGKYKALDFSTPEAGTSLIILKKATSTDHGPAAGWTEDKAVPAVFPSWNFTTGNWILDGQTGGGPGSWNSGFGFVVELFIPFVPSQGALCVFVGTISNITIRHTHFNSDRVGLLHGIKGTTGSCTGINISYCSFTDLFGVHFHMRNWRNSISEYNYFYANRSTPEWHSESVSSIGTNVNCIFRWSLYDRVEGTAVFAGVNQGVSDGWQIYGNIFSQSTIPLYYYWEPSPSSNQNELRNARIFNNTIVFGGPASQGAWVVQQGVNNLAYNNLFYKCDANSFASDAIHDYSFAVGNIRSADGPFERDEQIVAGEAHGHIGTLNPFVVSITDPIFADFKANTTPGFDTSSLLPENSRDLYGKLRGADGNWDRGAVEGDGAIDMATVRSPGTTSPSGSPTGASPSSEAQVTAPQIMDGAVRFVLPAAKGRGDGMDWDNALGSNFVPGRGATYYLGAGAYGPKVFTVGTSGDLLITLKKATLQDHGTNIGWQEAYAQEANFDSWQFLSGNWIIDGQTGGGPGAWNSGLGFRVQKIVPASSSATVLCAFAPDIRNIEIKHTHFTSDRIGPVGGIKGAGGSYSNIKLSYCAFTQLYGINVHVANWSDSIVERCYFAENKSTAEMPTAAVSSIGTNVNLTWRWNSFDRIEGSSVFWGLNRGLSDNWKIYGNIFSRSTTPIRYDWEPSPSSSQNEMRNAKILNNSILLGGPSSIGTWSIGFGANNVAFNNLFYKCDANSFSTSVAHNYTIAVGNIRSADGPFNRDDQVVEGESNGYVGKEPLFVTAFSDPLTSLPRGQTLAGINTSTLVPENSTDMFGGTRGVDGVWDRGALEFSLKPAAPSRLRAE